MLLRSLLIAGALTPLCLGGIAFWSTAFQATGAATLNPVASCAPTPSDEGAEEDNEPPRRPGGGRLS